MNLLQHVHHFTAGLDTLLAILGQQAVDQRLKHRHRRRQSRHRVFQVLDANVKRVTAIKRHLAGQHFKQHDAQRIKVTGAVQLFTTGLLRAHVFGRANHLADLGHVIVRRRRPGNAKIGQHRGAVLTKQDIVRLHVAVHITLAMGIIQRQRYLLGDTDNLAGFHAFFDTAGQIRAAQVFHRDIVVIILLADIVDRDDIGMGQARDNTCLAGKTLVERTVLLAFWHQHLQCHLAAKTFLDGQEHGCHAAFAQLAENGIAGNFRRTGNN